MPPPPPSFGLYPVSVEGVNDLLDEAGLEPSRRAGTMLTRAIQEWEHETRFRPFLAASSDPATATDRRYTPKPEGTHALDLGAGALAVTGVTLFNQLTQPLTEGVDYVLLPERAPLDGEPYTMLKFIRPWQQQERFVFGGPNAITVTAIWGYCLAADCPARVIDALQSRAAWLCARTLIAGEGGENGRLESAKESENMKKWDTAGLDRRQTALMDTWASDWASAIAWYRSPVML